MGVCTSKDVGATTVLPTASQLNKEIEKQINDDRLTLKVKLLLLGAAECGKSTVLKQMRILHTDGFTDDEVKAQKTLICTNIVEAMNTLVREMDELAIIPQTLNYEHTVKLFREVQASKTEEEITAIEPEMMALLLRLWADKGVKECFARRSEYHLADSVNYFFENLERICHPNYKPNYMDILYTRVPTTGVIEVKFTIKDVIFRVFDVGGQRSERRKWMHVFDDVNAIIFVMSLSEYDSTLFEDGKTNRMVESMTVFNQICNSEMFPVKTSIILFLNKKDLFEEKIRVQPITIAFPDYEGRQDFLEAALFIQKKFEDLNERPDDKLIYSHRTCATDTNQVQLVLDSVTDMILASTLRQAGVD